MDRWPGEHKPPWKRMNRVEATNQLIHKYRVKKHSTTELHSEIRWQTPEKSEERLVKMYLSFTEEVGEVLHGIATNAGYVLVFLWFWGPQRVDTIPDIIGDFDSDLKAQHELVWEKRWQLHWKKVKTQRETGMKLLGDNQQNHIRTKRMSDHLKVPHIHTQCLQTQLDGSYFLRVCQERSVDTTGTSPFPRDKQGWGKNWRLKTELVSNQET